MPKRAFITGASKGIGGGIAYGLAEAGWHVGINYYGDEEGAIETAREVEERSPNRAPCLRLQGDVGVSSDVDRMFGSILDEWGGLDLLVNNAGSNIRKRPEDLTFEEWREVQATNIDSAFLCCKACYSSLRENGGGKILNNGSMLSLFGSPWGPAYGASKGAMVQLTKSLATAWAADNIQVNCFLPER